MKHCINGHQMQDGDNFCRICGAGAKLNAGWPLPPPSSKPKSRINKSLRIFLFILLGVFVLCALAIIENTILSDKNSTQENTAEDGWTEIGSVCFSNEYGLTDWSNDDIEQIARALEPDLYKVYEDSTPDEIESRSKKQADLFVKIRLHLLTSRSFNNERGARLYIKQTGGSTCYEVRTNNNYRFPVQVGLFETKVGEYYNARIYENNSYIYFNINNL